MNTSTEICGSCTVLTRFKVERLLRPIDNDEGQEEAGGKVHYDESEDDEDVDLQRFA
jgi:hypothetical protein